MRIGIDAIAANEEVRTGVGQYAFSLFHSMMGTTPPGAEVILYTHKPLRDHWPTLPVGWTNRVLSWPFPGWRNLRLATEALCRYHDILFFPAASPTGHVRGTRMVTTVHDIGCVPRPDLYDPLDRRRQRVLLNRTIKKSDQLIAVSEFTKRELVEHEPSLEARIRVTPLGVSPMNLAEDERVSVLTRYNIRRPYLLFVGRVDKKKNLEGLVRGFAAFERKGDYQLVIAGPRGYEYEKIVARVQASHLVDHVVFVGSVSEREKAALETKATRFVSVSSYEGFGLTPLEAACYGVPSVLSDIPAHTEVMGSHATYVGQDCPEDIARGLNESLAIPHDSAVLRGHARAFSWDKTAQKTWHILMNN